MAKDVVSKQLATENIPLSYLDTDEDLTADSDLKIPSQKAIKAYVDATAGGGEGFNPQTTVEIMEDFVGGSNTAKNIGSLGWNITIGGGGGIANGLVSGEMENNVLGTIQIDSGAENNGTAITLENAVNQCPIYYAQGNMTTIIRVRNIQAADANTTLRIGLVTYARTNNDGVQHGMYFKATGTGNWYAVTANAGILTTTDTGIAQSTSYKQFKIVTNSNCSSIAFYIDGVLKATHTTNLPTKSLSGYLQIDNAATTSMKMNVDYFYLKVTGLTR